MMAGRRGNNEGSIFKRKTCHECKRVSSGEEKELKVCKHCATPLPSEGLWVGVATVGIDLVTGKPKRPTFYGQTRAEVAGKLAEAVQQAKTGQYIEPSKTTLGEWLDVWMTTYKKGQLRQGTFENYRLLIETHIKPRLGNIPISKLQTHMLQNFYTDKLTSGRLDGSGGLGARMIRHLHVIINQSLEQAAKESLIMRNPARYTSPPVAKSPKVSPPTAAELQTLAGAAASDRFYPAFVVAITCGVRRGELLGLCWDSVDLESGSITIRRQLVVRKGGAVLDETTKTAAGGRTIALTDDGIREIKALRKRQLEEKLLMGRAYDDRGLVFCWEDGRPLAPNAFLSRFQTILANAGLRRIRLHDLRHAHASLLLLRGVPAKLVQERLGHSSIAMTLDIYSHIMPEMQRMAADTLAGFLPKQKDPAKQGAK